MRTILAGRCWRRVATEGRLSGEETLDGPRRLPPSGAAFPFPPHFHGPLIGILTTLSILKHPVQIWTALVGSRRSIGRPSRLIRWTSAVGPYPTALASLLTIGRQSLEQIQPYCSPTGPDWLPLLLLGTARTVCRLNAG